MSKREPTSDNSGPQPNEKSLLSNDEAQSSESENVAAQYTRAALSGGGGSTPPDSTNQSFNSQHRIAAMLQLQQMRGNAYTQRVMRQIRLRPDPGKPLSTGIAEGLAAEGIAVQRVPINVPATEETLYTGNQTATGSQGAGRYSTNPADARDPTNTTGGTTQYELTRDDTNRNATVEVKIRFVNQARTVPAGGTTFPAPTVIPTSDPRRDFANRLCGTTDAPGPMLAPWNGQFVLISRRRPPPSGGTPAPTDAGATAGTPTSTPATSGGTGTPPTTSAPDEIRLNLRFRATPIWDLTTPAHHVVRLFGAGTPGGSAGNPIDATNFYTDTTSSGAYAATTDMIYAHEFGHMMGIPDEYSRSNDQMHRLFHRVSPTDETRMNTALDRATISRMVLAAIQPQLQTAIHNLSGEAATMFAATRPTISRQLATGIFQGWREGTILDTVATNVQGQMTAPTQSSLLGRVPAVLRFEALQNLSNLSFAQEVTDSEMAAGSLETLLNNILSTSVFQQRIVTIPASTGDMNVSINVASSVSTPAALTASATTIANSAMGQPVAPPAGARGRRTPTIYPSDTLLGQLQTLPATWRATANSMGDHVTAATISAKIQEAVVAALASGFDFSTVTSVRDLYQQLLRLVTNVSKTAARNALREFMTEGIRPMMDTQVRSILSMVEAETQRQASATATGSGSSASPGTPRDPALVAAVQQMETAMRTQLQNQPLPTTPATATAAEREDPRVSQTGAQDVTYDVNSLMGDNALGTGLRTDQMQRIVTLFNAQATLHNPATEEDFRVQHT